MARTTRPSEPKPVDAVLHQDRRVNIPTGQQAHLVENQEAAPTKVRYPRDPSLDPQLIWKGKDEQDGHDLVVPAVPVYIQEKIDPRALIENLRQTAASGEAEPELTLFNDFDGMGTLDPLERVEFYEHEGNWHNRMILGDSLVVMTSLAEKERLRGKVQMIYVDPPYGIKFGSNWQVSTRKAEVTDGRAEDASREPEVIKAFRDTWELGVHSYLTYLRDRLVVARELLTESGSVFVQIGDENVHLVRSVLDEVFGSGCHVVTIVVKKKGSQKSGLMDPVNDFILWYAKNPRSGAGRQVRFRALWERRELDAETLGEFRLVEMPDGSEYPIAAIPRPDGEVIDYRLRPAALFKDFPGARLFRPWPITNGGERANQMDPIALDDGRTFLPPRGRCWSHTSRSSDGSPSGMERVRLAGRLVASGKSLDFKRYLDDFALKTLSNWWDGLGGAADQVYVVQTNTEIIKRCLLMTTEPGDLVLDPTCGSGTAAFVAEAWGRRWITTDTSRVALALARTRLMSARYPYYLLLDSAEGAEAEAELSGQPAPEVSSKQDIRKGFVYRRAPRVTSGVIANTPDLLPGMTREEVEVAIARQAESEVLVDQPYEDRNRVRVSGRFTVESLSPHRVLEEDEADGVLAADPKVAGFETMILDNLRKAGVQNTFKGERLEFDRLEPLPGHQWLHATGEYTESDGVARRVAISIGPEFGTVGSEQVALAAQEATRGIPPDVLLVTGFAFDPQAWAKAKEINPNLAERSLGRLRVLLVRANPDLAMGDELLKKTGSGNLFSIFGEPDIDIRSADGEVIVEIRGLDVYDPTTGQVRSASTEDIACWFIDTNYDGTSFFVRHAYFTGGQQPYQSLAKTLRAEIDPDAWATLYSTVSRPFPRPSTGRIAVKVINHYGDEVLQVYDVT